MNASLLLLGAVVVCALPALAQPDQKPANGLPYPLISLEEAARLADAKPIKLHLKDVTVSAALKELERQTDSRMATPATDDFQLLDKKLSLDIETTSFKEASESIFEEAGVQATLSLWNGTGTWQVTSNDLNGEDGPLSGNEPFQVRALRSFSQLSKSISYGKKAFPQQNDNFNLSMMIVTPPQTPFLGLSHIKVTHADDDQGRSLIQNAQDMNFLRLNMMTPLGRQLNVPLQTPQPTSRTLSHFEGRVVCLLAKKYEMWEIPDVLDTKDTAHQFNTDGEKVSLLIKPAVLADSVTLEIQATSLVDDFQNRGGPGFLNPLLDTSQYGSMVRLIDANGQMLETNGASGSSTGRETKVQMNFRLPTQPFEMKDGQMVPAPPPPALVGPFKLVIKAPTEIVQTEVPFSFSNLPLP